MTAAIVIGGTDDLPSRTDSSEALGERLKGAVVGGTFRLDRCIGSGASSLVFEAEHLRLGRQFAVKLLRAELGGKRAAQRFRREATAIARLRSEHIVSIVDCGELDNGMPYLVMEHLEGSDLRRLLVQAGRLPVRRAVHLMIEACRGLSEVHRAGFVHRDLKPENLFVTRRSTGQDWCKILDFGVAKVGTTFNTAEGTILGTVRYMAPEQLENSNEIGPATDLYAIGATLFECLTGEPLIRTATLQEAMFQILNGSHSERIRRAELPANLAEVILACLAKSPGLRPASAADVIELLTNESTSVASSSDSTVSEDRDIRPARVKSRASRYVGLSSFTACSLAVVLVGAFIHWPLFPHEEARGSSAAVSASGSRGSVPASVVAEAQATTPITAPRASGTNSPPTVFSPATSTSAPMRAPVFVDTTVSKPRRSALLGRFDRANPYEE
jgi:serine/threonine protein kinase